MFGNIFLKVDTLDDEIKVKEIQTEINPSVENREALNKVNAELKKLYHYEEEFWKQKVEMN